MPTLNLTSSQDWGTQSGHPLEKLIAQRDVSEEGSLQPRCAAQDSCFSEAPERVREPREGQKFTIRKSMSVEVGRAGQNPGLYI